MKIYQVDAFTTEKFKGNPAGVCILPINVEADEVWMQSLASEMNLAETAFVQAKTDNTFSLRWFTPTTEVELCGHATLATSHILWTEGLLDINQTALFDTLSGCLEVTWAEVMGEALLTMNFPTDRITPCKEPVGLAMALGCEVINVYEGGLDLLVEVADEKTVTDLSPVIQQIAMIPVRCITVTAKADEQKSYDFVSRVFGPNVGIDEDPVTGSTHCSLTPFWAERLSKTKMKARQLSQRGGALDVEVLGDRVAISGQAVTVFKGELNV
ncbi:MAG: PhzF family phenazine biosynthesis protein [Cocleimonas sp.]